ncbi:30S ribosomal protein S5 [Candidatus Woesearchaeota archaeon]|nr:30S ribosomal protein S5 [Candidatus Woesearchaeota archaeon]
MTEKKTPRKEEPETPWEPKTSLGKKVLQKEITSIDQILDRGERIFEAEIVDRLLPEGKTELLFIGQAKGKFGGGQKRAFKQTQKKTPEGNKPSFNSFAIFGNENGYVGGGYGKSKDTVPAREKAMRNAKLNVFKVRRGCGSWECSCKTPHSIPFAVEGKMGSCIIRLMPAPKGKGLVVEEECQKLLRLAGIKDVWSKAFGQTKQKSNMLKACLIALKKLSDTKMKSEQAAALGVVEGAR